MNEANNAILDVRVIPRAGRSEIGGRRGNALLVRLAAAPVDGAANHELTDLLARLLHVPRQSLRIVRGERSRNKRVRVDAISSEELAARVAALIG
jgi:uncharacterized protein (TIGR00251 family)